MATQDSGCIFSTVRNTTGGRRRFSFLPPHGRELADNEQFTVFGDIFQAVQTLGPDRASNKRKRVALENALTRGDLTIVQTPAPILNDAGTVKMLGLRDGAFKPVDPCWLSSDSL